MFSNNKNEENKKIEQKQTNASAFFLHLIELKRFPRVKGL